MEWITDDSGAKEVGEKCGTLDVQFDMEVPGQGVNWGTVNLRARTRHWKQWRILRANVHWLRTSQLIIHVVWVPTHLQPADPLSRVRDINRR